MDSNRKRPRKRAPPKKKIPRSERSLVCLIQALEGRKVVVELQNDTIIRGTLDEADEYMNLVMSAVTTQTLQGLSSKYDFLYVRGRTVRFVHLPRSLDPAQAVEAQRKKLVDLRITEFKRRQGLARLGKGIDAATADGGGGEEADEQLLQGMLHGWDQGTMGAGQCGAPTQEGWAGEVFGEAGSDEVGGREAIGGGASGQALPPGVEVQGGIRIVPHRHHTRHRKDWAAVQVTEAKRAAEEARNTVIGQQVAPGALAQQVLPLWAAGTAGAAGIAASPAPGALMQQLLQPAVLQGGGQQPQSVPAELPSAGASQLVSAPQCQQGVLYSDLSSSGGDPRTVNVSGLESAHAAGSMHLELHGAQQLQQQQQQPKQEEDIYQFDFEME